MVGSKSSCIREPDLWPLLFTRLFPLSLLEKAAPCFVVRETRRLACFLLHFAVKAEGISGRLQVGLSLCPWRKTFSHRF